MVSKLSPCIYFILQLFDLANNGHNLSFHCWSHNVFRNLLHIDNSIVHILFRHHIGPKDHEMVDDGCYNGCLAGLGRLEVLVCTERLEFNRLHLHDR
jgi:hypothetical protein